METLICKRGDTLRRRFFFIEDGEPANLAGCTARMQVREFSRDGTGAVLIDVSTDDYLSVVVEAGAVDANIPGAMLDFVTPKGRNAQADIQLTYSDGTTVSGDTFQIKVEYDITRDD